MVRQAGFFDVEERLRELSAKGDDLERIAVLVDFAMFRGELYAWHYGLTEAQDREAMAVMRRG